MAWGKCWQQKTEQIKHYKHNFHVVHVKSTKRNFEVL